MFETLKRARDRFFGDGDASVAVPIFDGAFRPNNLLEAAPVFAEMPGLEDLAVSTDGVLHAARGNDVLRFDDAGGSTVVAQFDAPVQALASFIDGGFAVAAGGRIIFEGGTRHGESFDKVQGKSLICVNALQATSGGKLLISDGSQSRPYAQWSHDLLEHGHSGRVLEYDPATRQSRELAHGLAYCHGVCGDGTRVLASQSWAHNVLALDNAAHVPVLNALPGYPARISPAQGGGFWLSLFAGRTQLLEFVLREHDFRRKMMSTMEPHYWIAPALSSGHDFQEPLQGGSVRQMGILKPWAPPRSYGLVVRLGNDLRPRYSLHSRVGGKHHGIVSAVEHGAYLMVLSKGAGRILRLPLADLNGGNSHDTHS